MGMPFGYDPNEAEKLIHSEKDIIKTTYIEVKVDWLKDGK